MSYMKIYFFIFVCQNKEPLTPMVFWATGEPWNETLNGKHQL